MIIVTKLRAAAAAGVLLGAGVLAACSPASSSAAAPPPRASSALSAKAAHATYRIVPAASHSPAATAAPSSPTAVYKCHVHFENSNPLPDPKCTPGAIQSSDTVAVCTSGWATAHREEFSVAQREAAFAVYGIITANPAGYGEYDHLIPLELGGANTTANLWPEEGPIPNAKDTVENALHAAVCSGEVSLRTAQLAISGDWTTAEQVIPAHTSAPVTTHAPAPAVTHAPAPATTSAPAGCSPTTPSGNCYRAGEFCPAADQGMSGVAGNGAAITCKSDGSRDRWLAS